MAPPASRRTQQAPSGRRNTRSVRSGRRIPPEVLTMVCSHLIRDGALGTLAAMMRTGSHGYSAAGPVLYASIAIDDSFPSLLVGVEARRKRALLACVQHVSFGVTDHKMLDACFASIVQAVGTGDVGDVVSDKRELFPSVRGVHIASHAYAALALDRANTFFLRTYFRPRVVCIDYPSPVAVEGLVAPLVLRGKRVRDAYRELPPEPAPDAQRHFSARGVRGARQRAQVEERKEARAKAVAEVLGNPLALDELLQLWGSEEVTLHDFRFFDWAQGEGALSSDRHVDVLSWATGRVCIFAPTPTTEHLEGQEWPGFQCALKDVGRGRACTCNNKELWRHAARFLAGVHEQQGRLLYAQHARGSTAAPPATHTHTSNQADARALQRRPEPAPVVRSLKRYISSEVDGLAELRDKIWGTGAGAAFALRFDYEMPHWSEVPPCTCCCLGIEEGHDFKEEDEALLDWYAGDFLGPHAPPRDDETCVTPHPFDEREEPSDDWVNCDLAGIWDDDGTYGLIMDDWEGLWAERIAGAMARLPQGHI